MTMTRLWPTITCFASLAAFAANAQTPRESRLTSQRASQFADSILRLMTLDEKIGQLNQLPGMGTQNGPRAPQGGEALVRSGRVGSFLGIFGAEYTRELERIATRESRLRIPLLFALDVIHGFRTIYPVPIAEAASFDSARVEASARQAAVEATAHGLHWTFAPMVDIARDPRWGRIVEGAGEDPWLGSVMAAARVIGFQGGNHGVSLGAPDAMLATAKHFAAYGGAEGGRDYNSVELTERTLWETYLPPYEAAVKAGAAIVMSSFNDIGGSPAHASGWLLGDVLRGRWGFKGLVVSDWGGIEELMAHRVAATRGDAGILALRAGVDIDMSDGVYADSLAAAVRGGRIPVALVDSSVRRVLRLKYALGLFDDPYRFNDVARERHYTLAPEHVAAARIAAREGIVLLKNDNKTLPLRKSLRTIAVIGPLADDARAALGGWAGDGRPEEAISVLAGIRTALGPSTRIIQVRGAPVDTVDSSGFAAARSAASEAEAVVLVLGEREDMSGSAGVGRELVPRQPAWRRTRRRAVRRLQPGRQTPGHVPARDGADPDLLQSPEHGSSPRFGEPLHVEVSRHSVDAALSVRIWAELHDFRLREPQGVRADRPRGRFAGRVRRCEEQRRSRRRRSRPALHPRRCSQRGGAGEGAQGVSANHVAGR